MVVRGIDEGSVEGNSEEAQNNSHDRRAGEHDIIHERAGVGLEDISVSY